MKCPNCDNQKIDVLNEAKKKFYCGQCKTPFQIIDGEPQLDEDSKDTLEQYGKRITAIEEKFKPAEDQPEGGENEETETDERDSENYFFARSRQRDKKQ